MSCTKAGTMVRGSEEPRRACANLYPPRRGAYITSPRTYPLMVLPMSSPHLQGLHLHLTPPDPNRTLHSKTCTYQCPSHFCATKKKKHSKHGKSRKPTEIFGLAGIEMVSVTSKKTSQSPFKNQSGTPWGGGSTQAQA